MKNKESIYDVVVIGGTPGGIAAAIAAARMGCRTALCEYHYHFGGMAASGLGKSDIENREMIGGIFIEFIERVREHYKKCYGSDSHDFHLSRDGYYYEPSVAEAIFLDMLIAEGDRIDLFPGQELMDTLNTDDCLSKVRLRNRRNGDEQVFRAGVFVDATYEGDLYAAAGADYRLGRESRAEFNEKHAGVIYYDYEDHAFLPGSTGEGDQRLPAYTYRLCFCTDPERSILLDTPPAGYDADRYMPYHRDLKEGRLSAPKKLMPGWGYYPEHFDTLLRALSVTELPNGKIDANINPRPLAFPFAGKNAGYVEADWSRREIISQKHREIALGLVYFLQNDPSVPAAQKEMARQYGWPRDEFTDNQNFPFQLYVREARRLVGAYTLTENDVTMHDDVDGAFNCDDSIAVGEFPIDSFPCSPCQPGDRRVLEGYLGMLNHITRPYSIPYRIMIPERINGLIVPVAASTTHVAYSSIRMEPTWMALGQAAGTAAGLAIKEKWALRDLPMETLQNLLMEDGQVIQPQMRECVATL